ncbi:flagellar hook-length control protein FliK [Pseudophaeobacter sp.]|uniref:flagellar hook-length control protein FliK n=2 Tax=Pseudophaeobacter sp. TaxID=1971739 RepID=UPI003266D397
MLTNLLFGQVRSGAADPVGAKAAEGPQRQQANRSFSDHLDDRARQQETRSAAERDRSVRAEKAEEQREAKERSKAVDQNGSNAGKSTAAESADAPDPKDGVKTAETAVDSDAIEDRILQQTEESTEGAAAEGSEADATEGDTEADATDGDTEAETAMVAGETESAAQGAEVPPLGLRQDADLKPTTASASADPEMAGKTGKTAPVANAPVANAAAAIAGGEGDDVSAQVTLAEAAPESMTEAVEGEAVNVSRTSAQPAAADLAAAATAQTSTAAQKSSTQAVAAQTQSPADAVDAGQAAKPDQAQSDTPEVASTVLAGARSQDGALRPGDSRTTTGKSKPMPQTAGVNEAKAAQVDEPAAETKAETSQRETTGKSATSGEVLAAVAGQTRTAAPTEPGRRAEGRARESREAQAVVSGNASATPATKPTAAAVQISAVQQAFTAQMLAGDAAAKGGQSADSPLLSFETPSNLPGLSQLLTEAVFQPGTVHRPETPRLVAAQLAQAFVAKGERNVDVALNPEELGRVKMRVSTSETGITVVIQTERAETGDLMRRHINELADEFRKMGFETVSFEFNGGGASGGHTSSEGDSKSGPGGSGTTEMDDLSATELAEKQVQHLRLGNAGVDMRV